jgi:hypothetical protein
LNRPDDDQRNPSAGSIFSSETDTGQPVHRANGNSTTDSDTAHLVADYDSPAPSDTTTDGSGVMPDRATVVARQKERFGGIKVGSAFFGWLTATGMSVLLIALLAAAGVAFGVATNTTVSVDQAVQESQNATGTAQTVGLVVMALVVAAVAAIAGAQYDVFAQLNLPRLPVNEGQVTAVGAIAIGAAILAALLGAVLGGLAGMRFHRKVDNTGLEPLDQ